MMEGEHYLRILYSIQNDDEDDSDDDSDDDCDDVHKIVIMTRVLLVVEHNVRKPYVGGRNMQNVNS